MQWMSDEIREYLELSFNQYQYVCDAPLNRIDRSTRHTKQKSSLSVSTKLIFLIEAVVVTSTFLSTFVNCSVVEYHQLASTSTVLLS